MVYEISVHENFPLIIKVIMPSSKPINTSVVSVLDHV